MNKEEQFTVDICEAYLNNRTLNIPDGINYNALFKLLKHHNLLGVCHCAMVNANNKQFIPKDFLKAVTDSFFDYVYIYEQQNNCINEITNALSACDVRHILFKGSVIRNIYPVAESRAMGDIDLLIDEQNQHAVKKQLEALGYVCTAPNGTVQDYTKNNVIVEVHTQIISDIGSDVFDKPFDNAVFDGCTGKLNNDYEFAYQLAHIAHHFKFYGAGIRHILDLAVLQKFGSINIDNVFSLVEKCGLTTFAKVILSVCSQWFKIGESYIENTDKTQNYLCRCGAFGNMLSNKGAAISRREMEQGNRSSFKIKFHLLFPSYNKMKNIPYIKFIYGRPWLTPYAWCYRIFYNLKNRKHFMKKTVSAIGDSKTQRLAEQEFEFFEEIGLI